MSNFFADENSVIKLSPNVDVETTCNLYSKSTVSTSATSVALFLSPDRIFTSKSNEGTSSGENIPTQLDGQGDDDESETSSRLHQSLQNHSPLSPTESAEDKQRRETEESEQLAWAMMREESMSAYRMQMEFINSAGNEMSAEDLDAIQMAMGGGDALANDGEGDGQDGGNDDDSEDRDENQDSDIDQWDYDRLLALGDVIGDVKTERWRLKAKSVIGKLAQLTYAEMQLRHQSQSTADAATADAATADATTSSSNSFPRQKRVRTDPSCAVCMEVFVGDDRLCVLPCQHYFHVACTEGWVADHNSCPMCKSTISTTP